ATTALENSLMSPPALLVDALVLVLRELAVLDALFPARAVSLLPVAAAPLLRQRRAVPGLRVGLALVFAWLGGPGHLLALAARPEQERRCHDEGEFHERPPEGCCCGIAGGFPPGFPGPYAVPQPQTSEPLPRRSTRSR